VRRATLSLDVAAALAVVAAPSSRVLHAGIPGVSAEPIDDAADAITAMEVDRARTILSKLDAGETKVAYQLGRLAMEVGDCDEASKRLAPEAVQLFSEGDGLLTIARGCARAMAAVVTVEDKEHQVVVRLQDDADRALVPLIGDTIAKQRDVLEKDLGVKMPVPTRIDVVRDQFSLAAMTGLPHASAQTTGTVAIAKFGRVILLSPRAPSLGYGWRDTLAHELTHLALTRGTLDRAPLWLQEGVAKREEVRWRAPGPTDDNVPADAIAAAGLAKGLGRPLDGIGPSIAMLPSAREATVVFAEVTSFVRFISGDRAGAPGAPTASDVLPKLVAAYRKGLDTDAALLEVTGKDLKAWNGVWRPWVATKTQKLPAVLDLDLAGPSLASPAFDPRSAGRSLRLGELLLGRHHPKAARVELDPLAAHLSSDPLVSARIACARFQMGDAPSARLLVGEPTKITGDLGVWWAMRAEILRALGEPAGDIATSYDIAVAHDPLLVPVACGWEAALSPGDPWLVVAKGLCVTARARTWPELGQD
jgi:hypothetical protein